MRNDEWMKDGSEDDGFGWYQLELNEISCKTVRPPITTITCYTVKEHYCWNLAALFPVIFIRKGNPRQNIRMWYYPIDNF